MNEPYSILFQKDSEPTANDSLLKWGIACCDVPFILDGGSKDLEARDWPGESGEDVFIPAVLPLKPYDLEIKMVYVGPLSESYDNMVAFRNYLTGDDGLGASISIYNSYTRIGRRNCYWLDMSNLVFSKEGNEEILQFTLKIRITDPKTKVVAAKMGENLTLVNSYINV